MQANARITATGRPPKTRRPCRAGSRRHLLFLHPRGAGREIRSNRCLGRIPYKERPIAWRWIPGHLQGRNSGDRYPRAMPGTGTRTPIDRICRRAFPPITLNDPVGHSGPVLRGHRVGATRKGRLLPPVRAATLVLRNSETGGMNHLFALGTAKGWSPPPGGVTIDSAASGCHAMAARRTSPRRMWTRRARSAARPRATSRGVAAHLAYSGTLKRCILKAEAPAVEVSLGPHSDFNRKQEIFQ